MGASLHAQQSLLGPSETSCDFCCCYIFVVVLLLVHDQSGTIRVNEKRMPPRNLLPSCRKRVEILCFSALKSCLRLRIRTGSCSVKQYISLKSHLWDFPRTCPCPSEIRHYRGHPASRTKVSGSPSPVARTNRIYPAVSSRFSDRVV